MKSYLKNTNPVKRIKNRCKKGLAGLLVCLILLTSMLFLDKNLTETQATQTGQETEYHIIRPTIGRYKFNYTGNTNHYANWNDEKKTTVINHIYRDVPVGGHNCSTAELTKTAGAGRIVTAFLVWETRAKTPTQAVFFAGPGANHNKWVNPDYAVNDIRVTGRGTYKTMYCMAADVTGLVQQWGYGTYLVADIPYFNLGDGGDYGGGESPGSWQLIIVEEGDNFPVRLLALNMMSKFKMDAPLETEMSFGNGMKTSSSGKVTGQVFFGVSCANDVNMTEYIKAYNSGGGEIGTAVAHTTPSAGLYRNGVLANARDYGRSEQSPSFKSYNRGSIRMDLSDVNNIGNNATRIKASIQHGSWSTFFLLGVAVDISMPVFTATQTTSYSDGNVVVSGTARNISSAANTGAYGGKMKVTLDGALVPVQRTLSVNGVSAASATYEQINGQYTVTFAGGGLNNVMPGSTITYRIVCKTASNATEIYRNRDSFNGYIRSEGINTGVWVEGLSTAASEKKPIYRVTLKKEAGIDKVGGDGFSSMETFINDAYINILHRGVDDSGYNTYANGMLNNTTENDAVLLVKILALSTEYQNKFQPSGTTYTNTPAMNTQNNVYQLVADCYRMFLKREASAGEVNSWVQNAWNVRSSNTDGIQRIVHGIGNSAEAGIKLAAAYAFDADTKQVLYDTLDKNTYVKYVKAGTNVTVNATTIRDDLIARWKGEPQSFSSEKNPYSFTMPKQDIILTATAVEREKIYTVNHYLKDLGTTSYSLQETENKKGMLNDILNLADLKKEFTGFMYEKVLVNGTEAIEAIIPEEGSLVIDIYYNRNTYAVILNKGEGIENVYGGGNYEYEASVTIGASVASGYTWNSWNGTSNTEHQIHSFIMPAMDVTEIASATKNKPVDYYISYDLNGGILKQENPTSYNAETPDFTLNNPLKEGYEFIGWTGSCGNTPQIYVTISQGSEGNLNFKAEWIPITYTIHFNGNGATAGETPDVKGTYDEEVVFPENGFIKEDERGRSTFIGWSMDPDSSVPEYQPGDKGKNFTTEKNEVIEIYAIWDECPDIEAEDLYFTLKEARAGSITEGRLLEYARAFDKEDGEIAPGADTAKGTSFVVYDYQAEDFLEFEHEGSVTETYQVTDSCGNIYRKQIMVYIVDTAVKEMKKPGTTRFINEKYFNETAENGGLAEYSSWRTNEEYRMVLKKALDNLKNNRPEKTFHFTHEQILEMKQSVYENIVGESGDPKPIT